MPRTVAYLSSRSSAVPELNRASERLFHHGLERGVAECTFLLPVRADVFQFIIADACAQPGAIGERTYL